MEQNIVLRDQLARGDPNQQQQDAYNIDFAQLKNVSYSSTTHHHQVYTSAQLLSITDMTAGQRATTEPGLDVLSAHSGYVLGPNLSSSSSGLPMASTEVTIPVSGKTMAPTPMPLIANTCEMQTVGPPVGDIAGPSKGFVVANFADVSAFNGNPVAGSGGAVTESTVASLDRNMVDGLTGESMLNIVSALRLASYLPPATSNSSAGLTNLPSRPRGAEHSDGLCNLQLLTYTCADGIPNLKLVTVTDAILISVQFKCKTCEKAFTSPQALSAHNKSHGSREESGNSKKSVESLPPEGAQVSGQIKGLVDGMVAQAFKSANSEETPEESYVQTGEVMETTDVNRLLDDLQKSSERQRLCHICKKMFDVNELWKHYSDAHMEYKECQCFVCGKYLQTDRELFDHMMAFHTGLREDAVFRCAVCDKKFSAKPFLLNHMLQMHPGREEQSKAADTSSSKSPAKHSSGEKSSKSSCDNCEGTGMIMASGKHSCRICKKRLSDSRQLQKHMSEHSEQTICAVCHKVVFLKSLPKHMMLHTKPKSWECNQCDRAYRDKCDLRKHMRIHTGEKPYTCEICNKSFAHSSQLPRHLRTHSGDKPYQCLVCHKVFSRKFGLQQHMNRHASGKPFKCNQCGKEFRDRKGLKKHSVKHGHQATQVVVGTADSLATSALPS